MEKWKGSSLEPGENWRIYENMTIPGIYIQYNPEKLERTKYCKDGKRNDIFYIGIVRARQARSHVDREVLFYSEKGVWLS